MFHVNHEAHALRVVAGRVNLQLFHVNLLLGQVSA